MEKEIQEKIREAAEQGNLAEKIEQIIDQKVEEKVQERLENRKQESEKDSQKEKEEDGISRRSFLKKLGAGAIGLGAASLIPNASAYNIRSSDGLEVYDSNQKNLDVGNNGNVTVPNGNLSLSGNSLTNVNLIDGEDVSAVASNFRNHKSDTSNPHSVSLEQARSVNNSLSGDVDLGGNLIQNVNNIYACQDGGESTLHTSGAPRWNVYDDTNNQYIARFHEGGNVEIPNGDLNVGGNKTFSEFFEANSGGRIITRNPSSYDEVSLYRYQNQTKFYNHSTGNNLLTVLEGGNVKIPNGSLSIQGEKAATRTWVNSSADVPNADYADNAGDADTLDGNHAGDFAVNGHTHDNYVSRSGDTMTGSLSLPQLSTNGIGTAASSHHSTANASNGAVGTPWIYTAGVEAYTEKGGSSTGIFMGSDGYQTSSDEVAIVTQGNVNLKVGSNQDVHISNQLYESGSRVATRSWVDSNTSSFSGSHNDLTNISSNDHHSRYTDSEAVTAIENQGTINTNISGDADTLDGNHASAFASSGHNHDTRYVQEGGDTMTGTLKVKSNIKLTGEITENASI